MNEGFGDYTEYAKADVLKEAIINNGDILFSWSASLDVIIWDKGIGALNQHIFKVSSKKYPRSFYYYELINYLKHFKMMADLRKTTMGHITQEHLKQSKIVIPPIHLIIALDSKINIFIEKQILLQQQNQELAKLRDWLLPMLMNGQVKVK
jgi:type I restriction enzyme S subunit